MNLLARHVIFRALLRWGAALAFCLPLKHRPHARLRALGMLLPLLGLTYVLDPAAQSTSLHELQFSLLTLYVAFFVLLGMMIYACVEIDKKSALYCAVWSLLASQTAYECWHMVEVFFEWRGTPLDLRSLPVMLAQLAAGAFFYFVICTTLSRKMSYKGAYNIGPRQLTSAFFIGILFMFQAALLSSGQVVVLDRSLVMTMFVGQFYFLTLLYFQTEVFKLSAMQKEMDTLNLLYERQREQYQVARQNVQIINKRCHELKLQIAALRQMSSAPADPELKAHIDEAEKAAQLHLDAPHLWDGVKDPYLYTCVVRLSSDGTVVDEVSTRVGLRTFSVDSKNGFFLNGRPYPLHGVSRHQDRKGVGNAITREMHDEDMALIRELGANTVRLAHYQHDQYFYDLCDQYGMVVWAEIPYISEHLPNGRANTISQMKELIYQNYNHPCIVCWGVSNEITISTRDKADMLDNHRELNDLCHKMDSTRLTTLACYAMCGPFNPVAHITDLVSWNLYLGWYVPGLFLNDLWMDFFHLVYPGRPLGFSEYGAEGMPNLHSSKPRRGDHTEEYQAKYHEYMLRCFDRHKWMWATHVWNMFDFAADARDQGGEPGMNHKGLVTFDRKTRKDSFYLYKAWWSDENFVHICSKRFTDRTESEMEVKVYSNQKSVALYVNGEKAGEQTGEHVFSFRVPLTGEIEVKAVAGDCTDTASFRHVDTPNPSYKLVKTKSKSANWV